MTAFTSTAAEFIRCPAVLCRCLQNIMTFNKCSINGKTYGDPVDERGIAVDVTKVQLNRMIMVNFSVITRIIVSC